MIQIFFYFLSIFPHPLINFWPTQLKMEKKKRARSTLPLHREFKFNQEQLRTSMLYGIASCLSANERLSRMKKHFTEEAPNHAIMSRWKKKFVGGEFDVIDVQREGRPRIAFGLLSASF